MDYPARLLCPWDFTGKNPGLGCHFLLQIDEVWRTCCACRVFMVSAFLWMCVQMNIFSTWGHTSIILYCYLLKAFLLLLFLLKAFLVTFIFQFLSACNCFCDMKLASHFFFKFHYLFLAVLLCTGFPLAAVSRATLRCGAQVSQRGSSCCRVRALGA